MKRGEGARDATTRAAAAQVEFRAAALGKSIRYVLEYDYSEAAGRRSRGSSSKATCCAASTARTASRPKATRQHACTTSSTVELAVPLPGLLKRRAAGLIMGSALKELKKQVEAVA